MTGNEAASIPLVGSYSPSMEETKDFSKLVEKLMVEGGEHTAVSLFFYIYSILKCRSELTGSEFKKYL